MLRRIITGAVVLGLVGLLAVGTVSAVSRGPAVLVPASDNASDQAKDVAAQNGPEDTDEEVAAQDGEGVGEENGQGPQRVAQAIADEFGVTTDEVLALHDQGIGFGALFKLYALADAQGVSVNDLVGAATLTEGGERDFAFGEMKNSLTDEQAASLDSGPRNLGALVSGKAKSSAHGNSND